MATVMIVEDNMESSRFLQRMLQMEGHVAVCEAVGEGVVETVSRMKPDLLLVDVLLPGMSGIDLLKAVRESPGLQSVPVVMLSGVMDLQTQSQAFEAGASDYIIKGLDWESFWGRIEPYLPKN
jgi:DNA-binding response OmpR family regulator